MTQQIIDLGVGPDSQTGDSLYVAFTKVNDNFSELYTVFEGNSVTSLNANVIYSNNIVTTANIRSGNVFAYGNIETIGTIITSGVFYPNGTPIGAGTIENDLIPINANLYTVGNSANQFLAGFFSSNINLAGANLSIDNGLLVVNGQQVGNYSNSNVSSYLPLYSGDLDNVNNITASSISSTSTLNTTSLGTGALVVAGGASFAKDVRVGGNLFVANLIANSRLEVQDPLVYFTANAPYPYNYEIGFYSQFQTNIGHGYQHTGLVRDYTDNTWKLFSNVVPEPSGSSVDFSNAVYDKLLVGELSSVGNISASIFKGNFEGNITGNITAAGSNTQVLFNNQGAVAGDAGFRYDALTKTVIADNIIAGNSNIFIVNGQRVGVNTASFIDGAIFQINSTDSMLLPVGTSFERPANAQPGMLRYNTLISDIEFFNGNYWAAPITQFTLSVANAQPGTGSQTVFDLPIANATTAGTIISINGIVQQPVTAYSISGNLVTFTEAPSPEDVIDFRIFTTTSTLTGITDVYGTTGIYLDQVAGDKTIEFKNNAQTTLTLAANGQAHFMSDIASTNYQTGAIIADGGIGVTGNVNINGIMFAVAKNFLIDHPSKPGYKLQYSSLEGPENGVYVRGKVQNSNLIELPYYWKDLVDKDSISVTLTPIGQYQELFVTEINDSIIVIENRLVAPINCFYTVWGERKDLDKLTVEYKG